MRTSLQTILWRTTLATIFGAVLFSASAATAQSGDITFSSVTHNFGAVAEGQSANYGVVMTNNTSATFPFALTLGNTPGFSYQTSCGTEVLAGKNCEILFTFTSANNGTVSTTWSVAANGQTFSPSNGGTLTATGASAPGLTLSTASHTYGDQWVNTTSAVFGSVLQNSTTDPINISVVGSGNNNVFPLTLTNCGATLQPNTSCELEWTFTPASALGYSATYFISGIDTVTGAKMILTSGGNQVPGVNLYGVGVNSGVVTLTSSGYNFGEQGVSTMSQTYGTMLTNGTSSPVSLSFSGSSPHFTLVGNNCPTTLPSFATCEIEWAFNPQSSGELSFSYQVSASNGNGNVQVVSTTGNVNAITLSGMAIPGTLALKTNGHNFGPWVVGTTSNKYLTTLTNTTSVTLDLAFAYTLNSAITDYTLVGSTCGSSLAPSATCAIEWEYTPTLTGTQSAVYGIAATDASNGTRFAVTTSNVAQTGVKLVGTSVPTAGISLASDAQNFGEQGVGGGSATYGTVLYNTSGATATLSFAYSNATTAQNFKLVTNNCGSTLPSNSSCNLQWQFDPVTTGAISVTYDIHATVAGTSAAITSGDETANGVTLNGVGVN